MREDQFKNMRQRYGLEIKGIGRPLEEIRRTACPRRIFLTKEWHLSQARHAPRLTAIFFPCGKLVLVVLGRQKMGS